MVKISQASLAEHLDLSQQAVSRLLANGVLPSGSRGSYDLDACRIGYIRHIREVAAGRAPTEGEGANLVMQRARIAKAQADALEMKNDLAAGRVAPIDVTAAKVGALLASVRTRLLAIPVTVAPALSRCETIAEHAAVLTQHIHHALEELSHGATDDPRSNPDPDGRGGGKGADDPGGASVSGGRARRARGRQAQGDGG